LHPTAKPENTKLNNKIKLSDNTDFESKKFIIMFTLTTPPVYTYYYKSFSQNNDKNFTFLFYIEINITKMLRYNLGNKKCILIAVDLHKGI